MRSKSQMMVSVGLAIVGLAPAFGANAQATSSTTDSGAVEEVVVTATKEGATNLQKTPIAVSVVTGKDLINQQSTNLRDLTQFIPSLKISSASSNTIFYVRGVGGLNAGESDVSIYLDNVYLGRSNLVVGTNFLDIASVEVVKGPQGILFGRNSPGGAINLVSKTPTDEFHFQNVLSLGNYGSVDEAFTVSGAIMPGRLQASLSANRSYREPWFENIVPGKEDVGEQNRFAVRGALRFEVNENVVNVVRADYIYTDEAFATNLFNLVATPYPTLGNSIVGDFRKVAIDGQMRYREQSYGINNELTWKLNDALSLKSLTAYRSVKSSTITDGDSQDVTLSITRARNSHPQISQEFNLLNDFGRVSGVAGLYYYYEIPQLVGDTLNPAFPAANRPLSGAARNYQDTKTPTISTAAFIQETLHVTDRLGLVLGGRYTTEKKTLNQYNTRLRLTPGVAGDGTPFPGNPFIAVVSKTANKFTPKFGVDYQYSDDIMIYASATNGYKSGGYSNTASSFVGIDYGPETIWAYELGAKTEWLDRRLRVNLAVFRYDWKGLQFSALIAPSTSATTNAAKATVNGFEVDIIAKPMPDLTVTANATLLDSQYDNFTGQNVAVGLRPYLVGNPNFTPPGTFNASGKTLINSPKLSFSGTAQKDFDIGSGTAYVRGEYSYTSKTYFDPTNVPISSRPSFSLINASVGYRPIDSNWEASIWGKNLTDEEYITYVTATFVPTAPVGPPRTFGVRIVYTR